MKSETHEAYTAMKDALRPIKGTLKGALRKRPDLLAKLELCRTGQSLFVVHK